MSRNYLKGRFLRNKTAEQRKTKSKLSDLAVKSNRAIESVDKKITDSLFENCRLTVRNVSDSNLISSVLLNNGFSKADIKESVFISVPNDLLVMPIANWVLEKYTVNTSELSKITVYDKVNRQSNTIGFGFNNMEHDRGSKIVIGGRIGRQTYVAPFMLLKHLNSKNTLEYQQFNGFMLGLTENEKEFLKSKETTHYYEAYINSAANKVAESENLYNAWAFRAIDRYYKENRDFWNRESVLEVENFTESLFSLLENIDWRKSTKTIKQFVLREINEDLKELVSFYNGEAVVETINELELNKTKFKAVRSAIIDLAEYYLANESEEDNSFSIDEKLEDYDSNSKTDYSQSRGYSKTYLERPIVESAIARGVITEYINAEHYSRSAECYQMELELMAIRESAVAHEKEQKARFSQKAKEQAYWDRIERELGVEGLTAFKSASNFEINDFEGVL